ncbi:hypothetical protein [Saccharicrinis aurantiacus]|uniref:hypothetical protein n=1 Tax=Saccharicrinis aurantiacus TaxID=1849719 RepID=UPI00094F7F3B|nr:hypothetical protein [Saccharicrinis aurantiacus]
MNQQQTQQLCLMAEKSGLFNDIETYKALVELSVEQAKVINPLAPNIEQVLQFNAAMRTAELSEELLLLGDDEDEEQPEE